MARVTISHQLFQIVLGGLKLRRLYVHFHLPIRRPPQGKGQHSGPKLIVSKTLAWLQSPDPSRDTDSFRYTQIKEMQKTPPVRCHIPLSNF